MTKRAKWGVTAAILLMIAGMIAYPQLKNKFKASQDAASVVPTSGTSLRNQTLNINAEVLKYQSLTDKIMSTGSTLPDEEVDLAFESSGKVVAIYFTEGTHVKAGDLLAKINDAASPAKEAGSPSPFGQGSCLSPTYLVGERRRQPRGLRASSHRIREANGGYRAGQSEYRPDRASGSFRRDHRTSLRE